MAVATVLTIAGSDSSGGAGVQADLKTFVDHRVFGTCAVTAVTAQNTQGVTGVWPMTAECVVAQILAVLADFPVHAVKIGMLANREIIEAVSRVLMGVRAPIVLDPVLVATSGDRLLKGDALGALQSQLVPMASLVTPNLPELEALGGLPWVARQRVPVLVKGGHATGKVVVDRLYLPGRTEVTWEHERVRTRNTHGTGCTLASAIAARLARGTELADAVEGALDYVHGLLSAGAMVDLGEGNGPLLHGLVWP